MSPSAARLAAPYWVPLVLFALWPVINLLSRQSPPAIAAIMAVLLLGAALATGQGRDLRAAMREVVRAPHVWLAVLGVAVLWLSARSAPVPRRAMMAASQMSIGLVIGVALAVAARSVPAALASRAAIAAAFVGVPALVVMVRFWPQLHGVFGIRDLITHTNRTAVLLAMLLPVAGFWMERRFGRLAALALMAAMLGAILSSYSESAKLAALVGIGMLVLHRLIGVAAVWFAGAVALVIVLAAPWIGLHIYDLIPGWIFRHTDPLTFSARGDIWREYGAAALQRPFWGWGLEASFDPFAALDTKAFTPTQRKIMEIGHTHNAPLQLWFELGAIGAAVAAAAVAAVTLRIARMQAPAARAVAVALAASAFAISAVSHGAWQVWWYCLVALVVVLAPRSRSIAEG